MAILWYNLLAFGEKGEEREGLGIGIGERKERKGKGRVLESGRDEEYSSLCVVFLIIYL